MKKHLLLFLLLAISQGVYSQLSVGVAGGYTYNTLDADAGYYDREYHSKGGYSVAVPIEYSFCDWLSLRTELGYMTKSYSWVRDNNSNPDVLIVDECESYENGYLSIPVMASFSYGGERVRAFVNAGAWVGAWLNGQVGGKTVGFFNNEVNYIDSKYEFDSRKDNRFDAGLLCGIGAEFKVCSEVGIFVEGRYMYGLTNMQKSYKESYPRYNSTVLVQLGVTYNFNLK